MKYFIISLIALLTLVNGVSSTTFVCEQTTSSPTKYLRGDKMILCLNFIRNTTNGTQYSRQVYQLSVDQYSAIQSYGAYSSAINSTSQVDVFLVGQAGQLSNFTYPVPYINLLNNQDQVFPVFSLVVQMKSGEIVDVLWDNVCFQTDTCVDYTYTSTDGTKTLTGSNDAISGATSYCQTEKGYCDPKIYVSFIGTDKDGNYMQTGGVRMSRFRQFSTAQVYSNTQKAFSQKANQFNDNINNLN